MSQHTSSRYLSSCQTHCSMSLVTVSSAAVILCFISSMLKVNFSSKKKRTSPQNLRLLDHVHSICLAVSCKRFVVTCFWGKVCWSFCASIKVYSRLGGTSGDLGGHGPNCSPTAPLVALGLCSYINPL